MSGARLLAWRGQERLEELDLADLLGIDDARYAVEVAAAGGHHLLLSGPKGCGKTSLAERIPRHPARPEPCRVRSSSARSLARGHARPGRPGFPTRPPFSRAPPRREQGEPHRRRHRPGAARRGQPGPLPESSSSTSSRCSAPTSSRRCASLWRTAMSRWLAATSRSTLPARGMIVLAGEPVPVRRLLRRRPAEPLQLPRGAASRLPHQGHRPVADRVDIVRHLPPLRRHDGVADLRSPRVVGAGPPPGRGRAGAPGGALRRRELAPQRARARGRCCANGGHWTGPGSAWSTTQLYDGRLSRRGATRVHRLAWTVADLRRLDRPGLDEVDTALRLRTGDPLLALDAGRGSDDRAPRTSAWPGSR